MFFFVQKINSFSNLYWERDQALIPRLFYQVRELLIPA
jgi:hypothetical protein